MFMIIVSMIWFSLTTRIAGVNSPVGISPVIGVVPVMGVLLIGESVSPGALLLIAGAVSACLIALVAIMVGVAGQKMVRERFLSNA